MISRIYSSDKTIHQENSISAEPLQFIRCLSSDTKPTDVPNGTHLLEIDTGDHYYFDGTEGAVTQWLKVN